MLHSLLSLSDVVWRAALFVLLGIAPYAAPLEAHSAATPRTAITLAITRVLLAVALGIAAGVFVRRVRAREPWAALVGVALGVAAIVASIGLAGDRGPLGQGAWLAAPLAWVFLAALATDPLVRALDIERSRGRVRVILGVAALVLAGGSLLAAKGRLAPRDHLWDEVLAADPGSEPAALAVASRRRAEGDRRGAYDALAACAKSATRTCGCVTAGAIDAVDLGAYPEAKALLDASPSCELTPARGGAMAEAMVGTGDTEGGIRAADEVIARDPSAVNAVYARAWGTSLGGDLAATRPWAERAVALGRGVPAELLLGSVLFQLGDLEASKKAFAAALAHDPRSARATYDLALIAHKQNDYHAAREGYLRALKIEPTYLEARYNLALLAHEHGAVAEAQHHFVQFALTAPNDPRVAQLRAIVSAP